MQTHTQLCFLAWRHFTEQAIVNGDHADEFYNFRARRVLLRVWLNAVNRLKK